MPTVVKREELKTRRILNTILDMKYPPVARCRLLSRGVEPYHRLYLFSEDVVGDKGCLACGNCVDSCPVLRKESERLIKTEQRTSFALESTVGEDCEQCYSCVLACPQVDTNIKDYIVDEKVVDVIPQVKRITALDNYFMVIAALVFGIVIGAFLAW
ncbi:MAG: 4Fe-4S dicluster domain-containing protein [Syntrophales bacterium]|nr:4Fe-4S dicluster domain-containing protein [Syntrophales bacterium]